MSIRGIISLQKGNRVRFCYVGNDTNQLARSIMEMTPVEIEATYNGMCVLDSLKRSKKPQLTCTLVRLESDREFKEWIGYDIAYYLREKLTKKDLAPYAKRHETVNGQQLTGQELRTYLYIKSLLAGQPTANIPVVVEEREAYKYAGSFETDKPVITQADAINHQRPFFGCENICYYNLDTHEIKFWAGGDLTVCGKKTRINRRPPSIWPKLRHFKLTKSEITKLCKKFIG